MMEKPNKLRAALLGGLIIGVISGVPGLNLINCCCCAGILFGGVMSVYIYKKEFTPEMPPLESSDALIVGVIAGIAGALTATILSAVITLIIGPVETKMMRDIMERFIQQWEDNGTIPPGTVDNMRAEFERSVLEARSITGILRSMIFALIIYPIFSLLGGLIGYGIFGKKKSAAAPNQ